MIAEVFKDIRDQLDKITTHDGDNNDYEPPETWKGWYWYKDSVLEILDKLEKEWLEEEF